MGNATRKLPSRSHNQRTISKEFMEKEQILECYCIHVVTTFFVLYIR